MTTHYDIPIGHDETVEADGWHNATPATLEELVDRAVYYIDNDNYTDAAPLLYEVNRASWHTWRDFLRLLTVEQRTAAAIEYAKYYGVMTGRQLTAFFFARNWEAVAEPSNFEAYTSRNYFTEAA